MKESTARTIQVYGLIVLIGLSVITAIPTIESLLKGVTPPVESFAVTAIILTFALILGFTTFPARRVGEYLSRRSRRTISAVPAELAREASALSESAIKMWSSESAYIDSFQQNALDVLNQLSTHRSDPQFSSKVPFLEQAYGCYYFGWKNMHPIEEALAEEIAGLVELGDQINDAAFFILLRHLHRFALAGTKVANSFAQSVSNAGIANLSPDQARTWRQFAGKANRLIDDIGKLGQKTNQQFRLKESYFIPQVREL